MEIIVQGRATDFVKPDQVVLRFAFKTVRPDYNGALKDGVQNVSRFMDEIVSENGFLMENVKTHSFSVRKEWHYDSESNKKIFDGYAFEQFAQLKFDYDTQKLAKMLEALSLMGVDAPTCNVDFGIKDEKACERQILGDAYRDAENQARAIAEAAGKNLTYCAKVDFKPFGETFGDEMRYCSEAEFGSPELVRRAAMEKQVMGAAQQIVQTFVPEDIVVNESLYCLWIAE